MDIIDEFEIYDYQGELKQLFNSMHGVQLITMLFNWLKVNEKGKSSARGKPITVAGRRFDRSTYQNYSALAERCYCSASTVKRQVNKARKLGILYTKDSLAWMRTNDDLSNTHIPKRCLYFAMDFARLFELLEEVRQKGNEVSTAPSKINELGFSKVNVNSSTLQKDQDDPTRKGQNDPTRKGQNGISYNRYTNSSTNTSNKNRFSPCSSSIRSKEKKPEKNSPYGHREEKDFSPYGNEEKKKQNIGKGQNDLTESDLELKPTPNNADWIWRKAYAIETGGQHPRADEKSLKKWKDLLKSIPRSMALTFIAWSVRDWDIAYPYIHFNYNENPPSNPNLRYFFRHVDLFFAAFQSHSRGVKEEAIMAEKKAKLDQEKEAEKKAQEEHEVPFEDIPITDLPFEKRKEIFEKILGQKLD